MSLITVKTRVTRSREPESLIQNFVPRGYCASLLPREVKSAASHWLLISERASRDKVAEALNAAFYKARTSHNRATRMRLPAAVREMKIRRIQQQLNIMGELWRLEFAWCDARNVPGGRVELPTPAFSGPRSTGELPRHRGSKRL
jgi:hypothetical protein